MWDKLYSTYLFARDAHGEQRRKSGEPYYMHPINVAILVLDMIDDETVTIHETLEKNRTILERSAMTCPVLLSLHPDIEKEVTFNWK